MIPVVGLAGFSNAGKTTLLEKIIRELKHRGYRVGTIKHHHCDMELDKPGKDTWRHAEAGADAVVLVANTRLGKFCRTEEPINLRQALRELVDVDIVMVEGFKQEKIPKIEIFRSELHDALITPPEYILAVAGDRKFPGVPCYRLDDISGLCDLIETKFLQGGLHLADSTSDN